MGKSMENHGKIHETSMKIICTWVDCWICPLIYGCSNAFSSFFIFQIDHPVEFSLATVDCFSSPSLASSTCIELPSRQTDSKPSNLGTTTALGISGFPKPWRYPYSWMVFVRENAHLLDGWELGVPPSSDTVMSSLCCAMALENWKSILYPCKKYFHRTLNPCKSLNSMGRFL